MSDFISAMVDWTKEKENYVIKQLSTGTEKLAPRKNIFITIPLEFEEEIKLFVKEKRKEADKNNTLFLTRKKVELGLEFEKNNPPPHAKDFR